MIQAAWHLLLRWRARRAARWEALHVVRHPDGNVEVHGVSARALIRWYNKQNWKREYGPELPTHLRRPQL